MSDWARRAACVGYDPELFFVASCEDLAKSVCHGCPVVQECLRSAMVEEDIPGVRGGTSKRFGVRGGLTADERESLARVT